MKTIQFLLPVYDYHASHLDDHPFLTIQISKPNFFLNTTWTMEKSNSLKILEVCKVFPSDSPSRFFLPLTFFDRICLQAGPMAHLFFYELPNSNVDFSSIYLPKLKSSLSLTLQHYLPLAGNLTWPQDSNLPVIRYDTGDGVSLTVAETPSDFDYLSGDIFRESVELRSLLPNYPSSETLIPAMTLQITLFPKRGFSVAYVAHHAIMDGKSTSMFLHSWAYMCRNGESSGLPLELIPSFDRAFIEQQRDLEKVYPKGFGPIDPNSKTLPLFDMSPSRETLLGTFKLTRENIEALKNKAKTNTRVSSFTVTTAYVAMCLLKAEKQKASSVYIAFGADCRFRLDPPLPTTYFGNCLVPCGNSRDTKDFLSRDGFIAAIDVITELLANLNEGVLSVVERRQKRIPFSSLRSFVFISVGCSPRFELYKLDFGWGKPRKVDMISNDKGGTLSLADDRDDKGGIEIGIALKKHETQEFASVFAKGLEAL